MYRLSYSFPGGKFNYSVFIICLIGLLLFGFLEVRENSILTASIRAVLAFGTSLAPSVLGFLVAGFTIFVTITKVQIFEYMAIRRYRNTDHSYFKYNMSAFMLAFCHYITYLFLCAFLTIFAQPGGPLIVFSKSILQGQAYGKYDWYYIFLVVFLSFFGAWTIYLLLLLKSFIYNTYQVLTTSIRWGLEEKRLTTNSESVSEK